MILIISFIAALFPMVGYVLFIWWMDRYEREPLGLIIVNFLWGAMGAIFFGILGSVFLSSFMELLKFSSAEQGFYSSVVIAPISEEIAKGSFLFVMFFHKEFDNVTDGAVYGGSIGLGFGMTENFLYFVSFGNDYSSLIYLIIIRTLFSAVMHCMATAIFGASIGFIKFKSKGSKFPYVLGGLILAMMMHALWNGLVSFETTSILGIVFIILSIIIIVTLFQISLSIESKMIKFELKEEVDFGILNPIFAEIIPFTSKRNIKGWIPEKIKKDFIHTCTTLAFRKMQWKNVNSRTKKDSFEKDIISMRTKIMDIQSSL